MATHDYDIANQSGAAFRTDLNNALAAIQSNNSNSSSPATTVAYQWWADTNAGVLKIRNSSNNAWIELFQLDGTLTLEDGSASTPALAFRDDLNTGIFSSGANVFDIATGGVSRLQIDTSEITFNESGEDTDFRIEGDTDTRLFFLEAGTNRIGIGVDSAPLSKLHVQDVEGTTLTLGNTAAAASDGDYLSGIDFHIKDNNDSTGATCASIRTFADQNHTASAKGTALALFTVDDDTTTLDERLRIAHNGKVGIGTTNPAEQLVVMGTGDPTIRIQELASGAGKRLDLGVTDSGAVGFIGANQSASSLAFQTVGNERMRIDSSGRIQIGTTSNTLGSSGVFGEISLRGGTEGAGIHMADNDANVNAGFFTSDNSNFFVIRTITNHPIEIRTNNTKRMEVTSSGNVEITNLCVAGAGFAQVDNAQSLISQSSTGSATTTYFIGNASITTSSDQRLKENIVNTELNAITELNKVRVVDFNWNDPSDKAINNKNARGKWIGCLAQEMVNIFPHAVNAPRPEGKEIDHDSEHMWGMEYHNLVPVLIKAIQEFTAKIETLENKVAALEAA